MQDKAGTTDIKKAMEFIIEIDGMKNIFRQTKIVGNVRFENDAEHSWHLSMMAYVLRPFFGEDFTKKNGDIDVSRAVKMLLLHDIVELYAGDTYCYDAEAAKDKSEREQAAAVKIFAMLPADTGSDFMALWQEFDAEQTADAIFAAIMDKIQPLLLNYENSGLSWVEHGITRAQVEKRMGLALEHAPKELRDYVSGIIDGAAEKGYLL